MKILKNPRKAINLILILSVLAHIAFSLKMFIDVRRVQSDFGRWKEHAETYIEKQNSQLGFSELKKRAETFALNSQLAVEHTSEEVTRILRSYLFATAFNGLLLIIAITMNSVAKRHGL